MAGIRVRQRGAVGDRKGGKGRGAHTQIGHIRGHAHTQIHHIERVVDDFRSYAAHEAGNVGQGGPIAGHLVIRLQVHCRTGNSGQASKGGGLVIQAPFDLHI